MQAFVNQRVRSSGTSTLRTTLAQIAAFAILAVATGPASAAACAGFTDIDEASAFCADVQWIRNRAVTLGCSPTAYCPDNAVTRLQMAVFMSRLGKALQPAYLSTYQYVSSIDNSGGDRLCQLDAPAAGHARVAASTSAMIQYAAGAGATAFARLAVSTNQGVTWAPWSQYLVAGSAAYGALGTLSPAAAPITVPAGQPIRFAIQPFGSSGGQFEDVHCEFTVRLDSAMDPVEP